MAKVGAILSNAKEFVKGLQKWQIEYHLSIMKCLAEQADTARFNIADKQIIENKFKGITKVFTRQNGDIAAYLPRPYRRLSKEQPPVQGRLTSRSGTTSGIFRSPGKWNIPRTKAEARLKATGRLGKHLIFWVRPQNFNNRYEYLLRMSVVEKGFKYLKYRLAHEFDGHPFFRPGIDAINPGLYYILLQTEKTLG